MKNSLNFNIGGLPFFMEVKRVIDPSSDQDIYEVRHKIEVPFLIGTACISQTRYLHERTDVH